MKKTLFTLIVMFASAIAINAQSLTGKEWCTMVPDGEGNEIALELTFKNNGTCEVELVGVEEMKEGSMKMLIEVELEINGTYKLDDKDLKINLDKVNAKIDFDVDIEGVDAQSKAMMKQMIKPELEKGTAEAKKELLKVLPEIESMKVVSLDAHRLVLADNAGAEMTFYAK